MTETHFDINKKKTLIFDFDGTLVDIEPVFTKIFNMLALEFGYTPIRPEEIPKLKKLHLKSLIWRQLGWRLFLLPLLLRRGREEYYKLIPEVHLFPEMKEIINTLRTRGFHLGIISSSQKETISTLLKKFDIEMDFVFQSTLFNKAKTLKRVMRKRGLSLTETLYIGDEVRDIEACQKTGLDIISVSWGLNDKEALQKTGPLFIVDKPSSLLNLILQTK